MLGKPKATPRSAVARGNGKSALVAGIACSPWWIRPGRCTVGGVRWWCALRASRQVSRHLRGRGGHDEGEGGLPSEGLPRPGLVRTWRRSPTGTAGRGSGASGRIPGGLTGSGRCWFWRTNRLSGPRPPARRWSARSGPGSARFRARGSWRSGPVRLRPITGFSGCWTGPATATRRLTRPRATRPRSRCARSAGLTHRGRRSRACGGGCWPSGMRRNGTRTNWRHSARSGLTRA